jgi:hypothetical protein
VSSPDQVTPPRRPARWTGQDTEEDAVLIDPPVWAWHRAGEQATPQLELVAARSAVRDAATARALRAYLATKPSTSVRTTLELTL